MATNKRPELNTGKNLGPPPISTNNDRTEETFDGDASGKCEAIISNTFSSINYCQNICCPYFAFLFIVGTGMSASELHQLNGSGDRALNERINYSM
jgi:hypothetical protein